MGLKGSLRNVSTGVIAIPDSGGDHQWNFDGDDADAGTIFDQIGSLDGDIVGDPDFISGKGVDDIFLELDGSDDYIDLGSKTAFPELRENVEGTVFGWTRMDTSGGRQGLLTTDNTGSDTDFYLGEIDGEYAFRLALDDDSGFAIGGDVSDNVGEWIALAGTVDGSTIRVFVADPSNDYEVVEIANDGAPASTNNDWTHEISIGRETAGDQSYLEGGVDLSFYHPNPLSTSDLQSFVDESKHLYE